MKITCVCPTHGRAHVIGEAVESFLRQTYRGDKELLIVNDCPEQPLECDAPGVRIINLLEPIPDASAKFNRAVAEADGDLIAWWEDDDISLPMRIEVLGSLMTSIDAKYIRPAKAFMHQDGRITGHTENLFFGGCMFRRDYWLTTGGSVPGDWPDASAHVAMMKGGSGSTLHSAPSSTWFIYRWGGPVHHDSGTGEQDASKRFAMFRERTLNHRKFRPGLQRIVPGWRMDYAAQAAQWVADHAHDGLKCGTCGGMTNHCSCHAGQT